MLEEGDLGQRDAARAMLERISEAAMDPDDGAGRSADAEDRLSVENLLDLATAYVEIGDAKSARDLIARIDEFGDAYQRNQAAKLQERLGRSR